MPPTADVVSAVDAFYPQLQRRLLESGEWDRIKAILLAKLNESGWVDDVRHRSKEKARNANNLSFRGLLQDFGAQTETSVPLAVKREVNMTIRQCLDKQFE